MAELVKDVVCGMEIDPETSAGSSEHQGTMYYFCSVGCKQEFDAEPQKFLGGGAPEASAPAEAASSVAAPAEAAAGGSGKRWWEFWKS